MKKRISSILVAAMILALATPSFAGAIDLDTSGDDANVDLVGTVSSTAVVMSVTLPTQIDFAILTDADGKFTTLTSGTGKIFNNGPTAVDIDIVNVTDPGDLLSQADLALGASGAFNIQLTTPFTSQRLATIGNNKDRDIAVKEVGSNAGKDILDGEYTITTTLKVTAVASVAPTP